ncbi:hypothetical protein [Corynebacterium lipophiloflavum]|uniref:Uncharacterized protein n=1 Tax=Corynebacterium lipophiloflavum (strain ATCC 700352 / DSM 44291 / CCUG 37336 / JCM 10383 / DMMZ 1944) TaxID=525263 RepID=C0XRC3_CORLD|nr:hypothetical protein [Corynebacterium lipophiloflavum]EEI17206.1 hypothetical protein HMPREF0298_0993 [Corynebacterium lipophiloflavum DSM 44291]
MAQDADRSQASEKDKLLDAAVTRIGNSPTNFNSVDDFENAENETAATDEGHLDEHPNTEARTGQVEEGLDDGNNRSQL